MRYLLATALAVMLALPVAAQDFQKGYVAYQRGDYATALREWRPLAEQGNADAQYNLGVMYREGLGVSQDYAEALKWNRKAVEQGDALAQHNLGNMYQHGQGVPQDYNAAAKWYREAAEQGFAPAQYNLGFMYNFGWGLPQDDAEAMKWYRKAAEQGFADAQFRLGYMYALGSVYALFSADLFNNEEALQSAGRDVPQDHAEALKWYLKAADQGYAPAQHNLGVMYQHGTGVPQDDIQAHLWFNLAAIHLRSLQEATPELLSLQGAVTGDLDNIAKRMTPEQITKAQRLASEWLEKHGKAE